MQNENEIINLEYSHFETEIQNDFTENENAERILCDPGMIRKLTRKVHSSGAAGRPETFVFALPG